MKKLWLIPVLFILLMIIIIVLAGTPFALNFAKNKIVSTIQTQIGLPVEIRSLKGNLLYKVDIIGFKIHDVVSIEYSSISYNIFSLIQNKIDVNTVLITGLNIDLNNISPLMDKMTSREQKQTKKTQKPFEICVRKVELAECNLAGIINKKSIRFSLNLRGALTSRIFSIDELNIRTKKSDFSLKGNIPLNRNDFFAIRYTSYLDADEFGIEELKGNVRFNGRIEGEYANPIISNNAEFGLDYLNNRISGRLDLNWRVPFMDSLGINAHISVYTAIEQAREFTFKKKFTNLFVGIVMPFGEIRFPGSITSSFQDPALKGQIMGKLKYKKYISKLRGEITYQDSFLKIENVRIENKDLSVKLGGILSVVKSEIINGKLTLNCTDLLFINKFLETPVPLSGALEFNSQLSGKFDDPYIAGNLSIKNAKIFNENICRADFDFRFKNRAIYLEQGLIHSQRGILSIRGEYGINSSNFNVSIFSENIRFKSPEVFDKDTIRLSGNLGLEIRLRGNASAINGNGTIDLKNFIYDNWSFTDHTLLFDINNNLAEIRFSDFKRSFELGATIQLSETYPFKALLNLNHFEFGQYANLDQAYITTHIQSKGILTQPEMTETNIRIDSVYLLAQKNEIYNPEPLLIEIKNGLAHFHKAIIAFEDNNISIQGQVPLEKKYGEINLRIQADHIDAGSLKAMFGKGQMPEGFFNADVEITGNVFTNIKIRGLV